ncbi:MAG: SprB repeat-containing protein, partial [Phaeodactylibacter sp.]|nr:SprB repeat-containing protein [Phaeodactylibacter sp.]
MGAIKTLGLLTNSFNTLDCFGDCDGSIGVTAFTTGGVSNSYTFTWNGVPAIPPPGPMNTLTTSTVNNLCTGSYTVTLTDDQGCQIDTTYNMAEPAELVVSLVESLDESCNVGGDGSATVSVTGGTYPYNYTWSNGAAPDSVITGLSMGMYTVTVQDQNACQDTLTVAINMPTPPTILSFDNDTLDCASDINGMLTVTTVPGGSPIINYNWSNGASGPALTSINNLMPGTYSVSITAADGCIQVDTALVVAP